MPPIRRLVHHIGAGDQFGSGFVDINPNSKIPALLDRSGPEPVRVFDPGDPDPSGRKVRRLPAHQRRRAETFNWLMWQMGGAFHRRRLWPFLFLCAGKDRICDQPLCHGNQAFARRGRPPSGESRFLGDDYIADMATFGWFRGLIQGDAYGDAKTFLTCRIRMSGVGSARSMPAPPPSRPFRQQARRRA
jgi:GST-like protein